MRIRSRILALLVFAATASAAAGAPPPGDPFGDTVSWPQRSARPPATGLRMGSLGITLEKTTLDDIAAAAGRGRISHRGDAAGSLYWLCYTLPHERVWLVADGEMGGPRHAVTAIDARDSSASPDAACPSLPERLQPVSLHAGIRLGTSGRAVMKTLGPASRTQGAWRSFDYAGKRPGTCAPDGFDVQNWLQVRIEDDRVVGLRAGQVTSC